MKKATLILLFLLTVLSCKKADKANKLNQANKLIGTWENNSDKGNLVEIWKKENDTVYTGQSYFIKSKDTLHFETIQMKQIGDTVIYCSNVKGQNNDLALDFKLVSENNNQLVFENPKNDYPKKIIYKYITKDSLVVIISGIQQGKASKESFSMKKK
ncbi:DUF6265 family protein [Flavobacterium luteum]|uniref:DUF6265 domain-containing protein n=1 Tax=Flavobacterium luteum TaxID=2026654 RepID=A0A7J5ADM7_9FLAO|nr:DUF6265 family protein [Flavobacterium luteum]KAB1155687.1 hypothetical protein F6464_09180 [Flavobacterium luteum]